MSVGDETHAETQHHRGARSRPAGTEPFQRDVPTGQVSGWYQPDFAPVAQTFAENFIDRGEIGASVCVIHDGEPVVDLWGGASDLVSNQPWESDTISVVYSCTKAATALAAHLLAVRGQLDLDGPVAEVWPEFAQQGKERATLRMMLDHSVGVPALRGPVEPGELYDWDRMVARLEAEPAYWEPGERHGYHLLTFGWTVGELIRRVDGRSLGTFFRDEIATPLGADFWIGLPESEEGRVAPIRPYRRQKGEPINAFARLMLNDPQSIPALSTANSAAMNPNTRAFRAAEIGGGGGITNARGLAALFTPLSIGGGSFMPPEHIARMRRVSSASHRDVSLQIPTRFGAGFMVAMDNRRVLGADSLIIGDGAFGHAGMGGSVGFADPDVGLAFGYTMNQLGPGILLNPRGQRLVDAAYRSVLVM